MNGNWALPPSSERALLDRAEGLAGLTLGDIARRLGVPVPADLRRAKGFVGTLLERALGATARSKAAPDFEALGVELKSLPVTAAGKPCESTFVCTIELTDIGDMEWADSRVRKKLARVLWVPVRGERSLAVERRQVGTPFLWSPTEADEAELKNDWDELSGLIGRGDVDAISGHLGSVLQVRPKARDSRARRAGIDGDGMRVAVLPRGFYLRATFTERLLKERLLVAQPGSSGDTGMGRPASPRAK